MNDDREIDEFPALDNPVYLLIGAVAIVGAVILSLFGPSWIGAM